MRARHLTADHRAARLGGVLAMALGVGLLVFAVSSGEVDDGSSSDLATPSTEEPEATVLGEVIEATTLPDAPPASAVAFTTTSEVDEEEDDGDDDDGTPAPPPTIGSPTSATPPPTIGPPTSIVRPPTTTTTAQPQPACSDGVDNDDDGKVDMGEDPGCDDPADGDETDPPSS
jgi:hypothetical protein